MKERESSFHFRTFQKTDAEKVMALINEVFVEFGWSPGDENSFPDIRDNLYDGQRGEMRIVEQANQIVGVIGYHQLMNRTGIIENERIFLLRRLYLRKDVRGKGLGRALSEYVIDECKKRGSLLIELNTDKKMQSARSLYSSLGFTISAEKKSIVTFQLDLGDDVSQED